MEDSIRPPDPQPPTDNSTANPSSVEDGGSSAPSMARILISLFVFLILCAAECLLWMTGYAAGLKKPCDPPGNLILVPALFLVPVLLVLFFSICRRLGRATVSLSVTAFVILFAMESCCLRVGSELDGGIVSATSISYDKMQLRQVKEALKAYHDDYAAWPPSLSKLVPDRLKQIPSSRLGEQFPMRYALLDEGPAGSAWILWLPGQDWKYDIEDGPELRAALRELKAGKPSLWLAARIFDYTNGPLPHGDLVASSLGPIGNPSR